MVRFENIFYFLCQVFFSALLGGPLCRRPHPHPLQRAAEEELVARSRGRSGGRGVLVSESAPFIVFLFCKNSSPLEQVRGKKIVVDEGSGSRGEDSEYTDSRTSYLSRNGIGFTRMSLRTEVYVQLYYSTTKTSLKVFF